RLVHTYDSKLINYYQMFAGTLVLGAFLPLFHYLFPNERLVPTWADTFYLIVLALFCTVGLYVLFAEVLKKIPAFTVNLSFNLECIYAILIALLFCNEGREVNASFYVGLIFVVICVVLQSVISMRKKK